MPCMYLLLLVKYLGLVRPNFTRIPGKSNREMRSPAKTKTLSTLLTNTLAFNIFFGMEFSIPDFAFFAQVENLLFWK